MIQELIKLIIYMLPAYFANMAPVFGRFIPFFNTPINNKLFGSHKTWKGIILGVFVGIITGVLTQNDFLFGFLMSFGALTGDLLKSFFKRRIGIKPGERWVPFDQIDFVIGALIFSSPYYFIGWFNSLIIIIISFFLHITINHLAFYLKIRRELW